MTRRWTPLMLAVVVGLAAAGPARAGLIPVTVTVTPESANFRWAYAIVLPSDSQLRSGNYFTIYDFAGYVSDSANVPDGWTFSSDNLGTTPNRLDPLDKPELPNLTWTYNGPTISTGQQGLGNFWAVSLYEAKTSGPFTAQTYTTATGNVDSNITDTTVPVPVAPPPGVPEPGTLALAGLGLPFAAFARWFRKQSARAACRVRAAVGSVPASCG